MTARLTIDGDGFTLDESGEWKADSVGPTTKATAAYLNAKYHGVKNANTMDRHMAPGVGVATRAARELGGTIEIPQPRYMKNDGSIS